MSPTLRAGATPACTYGFQRQLSGVEAQTEISPTILAAAGESGNNQPCVVSAYDARGNGNGDIAVTITGDHENRVTDYTNVVCATDIGFFNSLKNVSPSLLARGYKDPHLVSYQESEPVMPKLEYIVRRLTPTECARLQGFADRWGHIEPKDSFSPEEYKFWLEVRNTYAAINGKQVKDYTEKQMLTWYNKLHTDSAEYKMWGNGIALPTALYCMQGIADALEEDAA